MFVKFTETKQNHNTAVHVVNAHQPKMVSELKSICHLYNVRHSVHTLAHAHTNVSALILVILSVLFTAVSQCLLHWRCSTNICWLKIFAPKLLKVKMERKLQESLELFKDYPLLTQRTNMILHIPNKRITITLVLWEGPCGIASRAWWLRARALEPECLGSNLGSITYKF